MPPVTQEWTHGLSMMQQSVLLTAVRGPDGLPKYHASKYLLRWFRRCILLSAMDGKVLEDPVEPNGGSFTGPSVAESTAGLSMGVCYFAAGRLRDGQLHSPSDAVYATYWEALDDWVSAYLRDIDEVPHHYQLHFMHATEIVGYKHPDYNTRQWWNGAYVRLARDMHLYPESEEQMDDRLGDNRDRWLAHADTATQD